MTITLAAGYPQGPGNATALSFTQAVTVVNNGDLFVVCTILSSSTITVTSITDTSSRITWHGSAVVKEVDAGTGVTAEEWYGVATSTGTTTITVNFSSSATGEFEVWELHESVGGLTWSVVTSSSKANTSSTTITYPPLTSASSGDQTYVGLAGIQNSSTGSPLPSGFVQLSTPGGNDAIYDLALAASTLFSPTDGQSPTGTSDTVGAIFTAASGAVAGSPTSASSPAFRVGAGPAFQPTVAHEYGSAAPIPFVAPPGVYVYQAVKRGGYN